MKFNVDYSRIFFDKYDLNDDQKRDNAHYILQKVLLETVGEGMFSIEDSCLEISDADFGKVMEFIKCVSILKHEFFILVTKKIEESNPVENPIDVVADFICKNYQYSYLTATYICEKLNLNRNVAELKFLTQHKMSISDYLRKTRVKKAVELIKTGFNNEKAALLAGFGSVKTMQRSFKSVLGKTPDDYRVRQLDIK